MLVGTRWLVLPEIHDSLYTGGKYLEFDWSSDATLRLHMIIRVLHTIRIRDDTRSSEKLGSPLTL